MAGQIPFDDRDGWMWLDGAFVPWREAKLHVLSHGLHYASSAFEGERAYNGRIFKMDQHHQRLIDSAAALDMKLPFSVQQLNEAAMGLLDKQGLTNAYLRPVVWRGSEALGISAHGHTVHVAIAAWDWPSYYPAELRARGLKLSLAKWRRPSPETAPVSAKVAGLYMICTLSKNAAEAEGCQDALLLDYRGYVAEATSANIFFVMDGELHTPQTDCILNGITRQTVLEIADDLGIKVNVRHISLDDLSGAQEAFLTGTAAEITPIASIKGTAGDMQANHTFTPGPVTQRVQEAYTALVNGIK